MKVTFELTDAQLDAIADRVAAKMGKSTGNPMTIAEFATAIGRSKGFVRKRVEAGIILRSQQPGEIQIPHSELERYRNGGVKKA